MTPAKHVSAVAELTSLTSLSHLLFHWCPLCRLGSHSIIVAVISLNAPLARLSLILLLVLLRLFVRFVLVFVLFLFLLLVRLIIKFPLLGLRLLTKRR